MPKAQEVFSQHDEQLHILKHAGSSGRLLDIGAFDGKTFSNSLALIENGWGGVLVEPSIGPFKALLALHGGNGRISLVHSAISRKSEFCKFWGTNDGVSTLSEAHHDKWREATEFAEPYYLRTVTLVELLDYFPGHFDFLNIDTEGSSAELMVEWFTTVVALKRMLPKVICVEHDGVQPHIMYFATRHGYKCEYESDENLVLVRGAA
jgi:FkbM family methyltransferase